jgi:hypothetical protein
MAEARAETRGSKSGITGTWQAAACRQGPLLVAWLCRGPDKSVRHNRRGAVDDDADGEADSTTLARERKCWTRRALPKESRHEIKQQQKAIHQVPDRKIAVPRMGQTTRGMPGLKKIAVLTPITNQVCREEGQAKKKPMETKTNTSFKLSANMKRLPWTAQLDAALTTLLWVLHPMAKPLAALKPACQCQLLRTEAATDFDSTIASTQASSPNAKIINRQIGRWEGTAFFYKLVISPSWAVTQPSPPSFSR